jgi:hypothetical protein
VAITICRMLMTTRGPVERTDVVAVGAENPLKVPPLIVAELAMHPDDTPSSEG